MVRAGLLLSASLATLFAPPASATLKCEYCLNKSGTYCSYQTSGDDSKAAYGICYKTAFSEGEGCPDTYGALKDTYADVTLEVKEFDESNGCTGAAKELADANSVVFNDLSDGEAVTGIDTCGACVEGDNTWCQPKSSSSANLAGGYCAQGQSSDLTCMELLLLDDLDTMEMIDTAEDCPTGIPTTSPDDTTKSPDDSTKSTTASDEGPCKTCVDDSKVFCAYYTTGADDAKTYLYHACIDANETCPPMTGIDAIYSGLVANTEVSPDMVDAVRNCPAVPENADLDLDADLTLTVKTTCSDCISSEGKWCSYDADTVNGGYCGVHGKCAKLEDFNSQSIDNDPANRDPSTDCDDPSSGFALTSSIPLATCAAALTILA